MILLSQIRQFCMHWLLLSSFLFGSLHLNAEPVLNSAPTANFQAIEKLDDILQALRAEQYQPVDQPKSHFRDYANSPLRVRWFYLEQHSYQTFDRSYTLIKNFDNIMERALQAKRMGNRSQLEKMVKAGEILLVDPMTMLFKLEKFIDTSDPDITLGNAYHGFQTAEAMRVYIEQNPKMTSDMISQSVVVALFHDIGKVLAAEMGFPQWLVVGDTYPLGCPFDARIVLKKMKITEDLHQKMREIPAFSSLLQKLDAEHQRELDSFSLCPDSQRTFVPQLKSSDVAVSPEYGRYTPGAGIDQFIMAFGHDEYAYRVFAAQTTLKKEFLHILRFHSFYPLHREGAYQWALHPDDMASLQWIQIFNEFDLYSKNPTPPNIHRLRPIYQQLIDRVLPREPDGSPGLLIWPILHYVK